MNRDSNTTLPSRALRNASASNPGSYDVRKDIPIFTIIVKYHPRPSQMPILAERRRSLSLARSDPKGNHVQFSSGVAIPDLPPSKPSPKPTINQSFPRHEVASLYFPLDFEAHGTSAKAKDNPTGFRGISHIGGIFMPREQDGVDTTRAIENGY